ncbi:hypothetical protein [Kribbella sp. DT2]|uniref:hypothetical protein n=1 Tax=Kribbella sp. DT2 TaxID=3393427 RepID=UPI003CF2F08C
MADKAVDTLIIAMNQAVVEHTGGLSPVYGREVLEVTPQLRAAIEPIADNLDVLARLAPDPRAVLAQRGGQVVDQRQYLREHLTELVATCAGALERDDRLPGTPGSPEQDRLAVAVNKAYALEATPGLLPKVVKNGRPGDLGEFKWRVPEGDVLAARAMAVAVGARTGRQYQDVLTAQVAAGKGGAAPVAAEMLLNKQGPAYERLPQPEKEALLRQVARGLETGFAQRDLQGAATREQTTAVEARQLDVRGGVTPVDQASATAGAEVRALHDFLDRLPEWHAAVRERPAAAALGAAGDPAIPPLRAVRLHTAGSDAPRIAAAEPKAPQRER